MFTLGQLTVGWRDLLDIFLVAVLCYWKRNRQLLPTFKIS